jgi:hypothetical protein
MRGERPIAAARGLRCGTKSRLVMPRGWKKRRNGRPKLWRIDLEGAPLTAAFGRLWSMRRASPMSASGHSRQRHSAPVPNNVRCCSNSEQTRVRLESPLSANRVTSHCGKTASPCAVGPHRSRSQTCRDQQAELCGSELPNSQPRMV